MSHRHVLTVLLLAALAPGAVPSAGAQEAPPSYALAFLGPGSPTALNNTGIVIGVRVVGSAYEPLVSVDGGRWTTLPVPAGAVSVLPTDVNDAGVIVGTAFGPDWNPTAVRWTPASGGYRVEVLPRIAGDASSYALAINNLGQIVGARRALGYSPTGSGWLYAGGGAVVDLAAAYGWWTYPVDLNDADQVIGGAERLDLPTGQVTWIGDGPSNYNAVTGVAINASGFVAGHASLRSSSLVILSVFRYEGPAGWRFIAGSSRYAQASSINGRGDVGYGELGAGVYFDGLGTFAVGDLLDPAARSGGWAITGSGVEINDARAIATVGRNAVTGESGGVLLTPLGSLPAPTAPAHLTAVAHPATAAEPYDAIVLAWENTSPLTRGYELQRRPAGATEWASVPLVPPGTATSHTDTAVVAATTYEYRVRAVGLGGSSPWSATAAATAPGAAALPLRVASIALGARASGGTVTVTGTVVVKSAAGAVPGASVAIRWAVPGGTTVTATGVTDSNGRARFTVSGPRGTYTITVTGVTKAGYVLDAAASVLTRSVTK